MATSHTLTGETILISGEYYVLVQNQPEVIVRKLWTTKAVKVKMGLHGRTNETIFHPILIGGEPSMVTIFNSQFNPDRYDFVKILED